MDKFNAGDRVECVDLDGKKQSQHLTLGKLYTVSEHKGGWLCVVNDEGHVQSYYVHRFELAKLCKRRWIISSEEYGEFHPATTPREYKTLVQAKRVANEMAEKHNLPFYVFETVYVAKPVVTTVTTVEGEDL